MPISNAAAAQPAILVLGDSLSAAYGFDQRLGWVSLLRQQLAAEGYPHLVVNASISGDTTAGGLGRLPQALRQHQPSILILELGSNDGLRGVDFSTIESNLRQMVESARAEGCAVLLLGMRMPPNFGKIFTERFHRIFVDLAQRMSLPLVPFFLQEVADKPGWMQADNLHPTADAQAQMLNNVWPYLQPLLESPSG